MGRPVILGFGWGGREEEGLAGAPSRGRASLRPSVPLLFSARGARPARPQCASAGGGGASGWPRPSKALAPPLPLPPPPPPGRSIRALPISIQPRHNFPETREIPARRRRKYSPRRRRLEGAGARRPARGSRRRGPCAGRLGQPGDPARLAAGRPEELGCPGLRAGRPAAFLPLASPAPLRSWGGGSCPPSREARSSRPPRSRATSREPGRSGRQVLPKLPRWSCRAGRRRSPWDSRAAR